MTHLTMIYLPPPQTRFPDPVSLHISAFLLSSMSVLHSLVSFILIFFSTSLPLPYTLCFVHNLFPSVQLVS